MWRSCAAGVLAVLLACETPTDPALCTPGLCDALPPVVDASSLEPRPWLPAGEQNCPAGMKATWVVVQIVPDRIGKVGCVPAGVVPLGAACRFGPAGDTTGYDDCAAGLVCSAGTCHDICLFSGPPETGCGAATCVEDPLLFINGADQALAGVCPPT